MARLYEHWVYGGFLAGIMILVLMPLLASGWSPTFTAIFLLLPIYMLHQYEEHDADRFRIYVNRMIGQGQAVLTPGAIFVINIGAVWVLDVVVIYLAWRVDPGLGLIAVYLMVVNAIVHIAGAIRSRAYNPGLGTAIVLFLPFGAYAWWRIEAEGPPMADHLIGLAIAIAVHALIVAYAIRRRSALRSGRPAPAR